MVSKSTASSFESLILRPFIIASVSAIGSKLARCCDCTGSVESLPFLPAFFLGFRGFLDFVPFVAASGAPCPVFPRSRLAALGSPRLLASASSSSSASLNTDPSLCESSTITGPSSSSPSSSIFLLRLISDFRVRPAAMVAAYTVLQAVVDGVEVREREHRDAAGAVAGQTGGCKERSGIRKRSAGADSVVFASQALSFAVGTRC